MIYVQTSEWLEVTRRGLFSPFVPSCYHFVLIASGARVLSSVNRCMQGAESIKRCLSCLLDHLACSSLVIGIPIQLLWSYWATLYLPFTEMMFKNCLIPAWIHSPPQEKQTHKLRPTGSEIDRGIHQGIWSSLTCELHSEGKTCELIIENILSDICILFWTCFSLPLAFSLSL